eukprot:1480407-Amphidinium_carterae.1
MKIAAIIATQISDANKKEERINCNKSCNTRVSVRTNLLLGHTSKSTVEHKKQHYSSSSPFCGFTSKKEVQKSISHQDCIALAWNVHIAVMPGGAGS